MNYLLKKLSLLLCLTCANLAFATAPTLHIGNAPTSLTVSYGAKKLSTTLQYDLVSDLAGKSQNLSNFQLSSSAPSGKVTVNQITNTCNGVLPPQGGTGVCSVMVELLLTGVQPPSHSAPSPTTYNLQFTYGNGRGTTMSSPNITISFASGNQIANASRTFTFNNHCSYDVWFGISAGATASIKPSIAGDPQSCLVDSDCYPGSTCHDVGSVKHCFWANPPSTNAIYKLVKTSGTNTATFPVYDNGIEAVWSGGIAGRTMCGGKPCETGDCGSTNAGGPCLATKGFAAPVSTAEFTLLSNNTIVYQNTLNGNTAADTYDVTVINGVTTPISMTPSNGTWGGINAPYSCGVPGAASSAQSSAACNWSGFAVPNDSYVYVKYDAAAIACPIGNECTSPKVCGSSFNPVGSKVLSKKCGTALGFWTADAICARDAAYDNGDTIPASSIQCAKMDDPTHNPTATQTQLYGCSGTPFSHSCYTAGAVSEKCCGCVDWSSIPGINVPAATTESCNSIQSTYWVDYSQPKLEWLKMACPNVYVYPYDDASSTFTCQKLNAAKKNVVNYTIDFCPVS